MWQIQKFGKLGWVLKIALGNGHGFCIVDSRSPKLRVPPLPIDRMLRDIFRVSAIKCTLLPIFSLPCSWWSTTKCDRLPTWYQRHCKPWRSWKYHHLYRAFKQRQLWRLHHYKQNTCSRSFLYCWYNYCGVRVLWRVWQHGRVLIWHHNHWR